MRALATTGAVDRLSTTGADRVSARLHETCLSLGLDPREVAEREHLDVIISLPDQAACDRLERRCADELGLAVRDRLPLLQGFSTRLDQEDLELLGDELPAGAVVALDRPLTFLPMLDDSDVLPLDPPLETAFQPFLPGIERVHEQGFTGRGITVAVIDSGLYPHPDFKERIKDWVDFTTERKPTPVDPVGHGTNVGGILAGNGKLSGGKLKGAAPEANLVGVRIGTVREAIAGLQWVIDNKQRLGIQVVNLSLGEEARLPFKQDLWAQATRKAIEAGLVVVVAAGNEGPGAGSISTPGTLPEAITVGAYDNHKTPDPADDSIARDSSRGPTAHDQVAKPDLVAPGVRVYGALSPGSRKDNAERPRIARDYSAESGTSQATPQVAGLVACLLQANPGLDHHSLKALLKQAAVRSVPGGENDQGAGLVQADRALELALQTR